jgi:two-component system, OmpR family, copper resistance phosphate regulon response regulator CusR
LPPAATAAPRARVRLRNDRRFEGSIVKILVVEDETKAAEYLRQGLTESGYTVEVALTGTDGLHAAATGDHDLVILDVMLPGVDGFAVLSALRTSKQTPVLMLTARGKADDRVHGFDLGADDYLVKPFHFPELLARVRALLKRGQPASADLSLRVADLEIDPVRHRATRSGQRIDLTAKEFALLTLLAQRTGDVLSRTQIASLVWDIHFDSDTNLIDVAVRRLRAKVDDPFADKLIHTVRGVGYVLEARLVP